MTKPRIIVVLGMHRSGTSAIARGLKTLSVELGDNLMPPALNNNERGFWEDMDINRFNERLFSKMGTSWDRVTPLEAEILTKEDFSAERCDAVALIERKLSKAPIFGFKDPRTSILLPFWKTIFEDMGVEDNYIIAVRNPLEVAKSLRTRDRLETTLGLMLWLKYNWAAITHSTGCKRVSVSYRNLMEDPGGQLLRISEALNLPPPTPTSPATFEYTNEFLSNELRHHRISDNEIQRCSSIPAEVQSLYELLLQWSEDDGAAEVPTKIKARVERFLEASRPLLQLNDELKKQTIAKEKTRLELTASLEQTKGKLTESEKRISVLEGIEQATQKEINDLRDTLRCTNKELEANSLQAINLEEAHRKEIEELRTTIQTHTTRSAAQDTRLSEAEIAIARLKSELAEQEAMTQRARQQILQAHQRAVEDRNEQVARVNSLLDSSKKTLADAIETLRLREEKILQLEKRLEQQQSALLEAETRRKTLHLTETRLKQVETALKKSEETLRLKQQELASGLQQSALIEAKLSAFQSEISDKTKTIRLLRNEVHALRASTSWKVTKPFRLMRSLLTLP